MPIHIGTSTKNQQQITLGTTQMQKVYVGDKLVWSKLTEPTLINYGLIYNWYSVMSTKNISSSTDWEVLTSSQYSTLTTYLGGSSIAGGKMKETGTTHWNSPNAWADNSSGFNGRGTGYRDGLTGAFSSLNQLSFLSTKTAGTSGGVTYYLSYNSASFNMNNTYTAKNGFSLRLIYVGSGSPSSYIGNDGKVYRVIQIGTQWVIADYLAETKYRNGDWVHGFDGGTYTPISNSAWATLTTEGCCAYADDLANV